MELRRAVAPDFGSARLLRRLLCDVIGTLRGLPSETLDGQRIFLCDETVSPFAAGALFPKIVIPKTAWERLDKSDLQTIVLHERTHIRLGHLWLFYFWDALSALLWINPFPRLCAAKLREDMEHICDAVTIHDSGRDAVSYGRVMLKSMALLRQEAALPATFAGATAFHEAKERFQRVREKKRGAARRKARTWTRRPQRRRGGSYRKRVSVWDRPRAGSRRPKRK